MPKLTESELQALLAREPEWHLAEGTLVRDWEFPDFLAAVAFVNHVAALAEQAGHHPDIDIRYNRVRLGLISHDAGGLTSRDAALAARISASLLKQSMGI